MAAADSKAPLTGARRTRSPGRVGEFSPVAPRRATRAARDVPPSRVVEIAGAGTTDVVEREIDVPVSGACIIGDTSSTGSPGERPTDRRHPGVDHAGVDLDTGIRTSGCWAGRE